MHLIAVGNEFFNLNYVVWAQLVESEGELRMLIDTPSPHGATAQLARFITLKGSQALAVADYLLSKSTVLE